jgi:pimeloyl-ACP methyl ester carboxylesterase
MAEQWTEEKVRVGETELCVLKGGQGKPLLYLHGELGFEGWCKWHAALAQQRTLLVPLHPGFGRSQAADWIMDIRDLAAFYSRFIREQKLSPADVIGFSLGGWIAAEIAVANCAQLHKMILVGAVGLRPPEGEIMDMYTVTARRRPSSELSMAAVPSLRRSKARRSGRRGRTRAPPPRGSRGNPTCSPRACRTC